MKLYQMADPVRYSRMTTAERRETFLLENMFSPGTIEFAYVDLDRTVIGSAVPTIAPLTLETEPELKADFFLERRELGVLNVGGAGTVTVDGKSFELSKLSCVYVGRGSRAVSFTSTDAENPACFYLLSYPAHKEYPTAMVRFEDLEGLKLGSSETCNERTIYKTIFKDGLQSCQLVMGFTLLAPGSNWNTMPPHTHMRRSEVYFYFDMDPAHRVVHLMGPPSRDQPPYRGRPSGRRQPRLVHPRRRRHQELHLLLGHGRRKPGVYRHGPRHHRRPPVTEPDPMSELDPQLRGLPIGVPEGEASVITPRQTPSAGLKLRAAQDCRFALIGLGEVMLRFDPGEGRIAQARTFRVWEGGGEYNVTRGLRRCFGLKTSIVTALVDNPVGRLVEDLLLQGGVDTGNIHWQAFDGVGAEARNGVYFLERGFGIRGGVGMMDRGHTAIAQLRPGQVDWDAIFAEGIRWFHTGGVMAALSDTSAELVRTGMEAAQRHGAIVSYDCNYRPSLWTKKGGRHGSVAMNRTLMPHVDVLFGHEGDIAATVGESSLSAPWHTLESYGPMAARVVEEFPHVKVIASTVRQAKTASRNAWGGFCWAEGVVHEGLRFDDLEILDRVGGGDSFASGLIYGLLQGKGIQWALDCGVVHGALAMTTAGDGSMATLPEVERLMRGGTAAVQR